MSRPTDIKKAKFVIFWPRKGQTWQLETTVFDFFFQNLNSDFTDSALGSTDKSPLPYGNFQLRESTMQSILNNPKYGPRSELGEKMEMSSSPPVVFFRHHFFTFFI